MWWCVGGFSSSWSGSGDERSVGGSSVVSDVLGSLCSSVCCY